jgi:hypothetical protein
MNGPPIAPEDKPGPEDGPDPLDRAYRDASDRDGARPDPRVRATILARARSSARPAANDPRWHWQAAAGIAAMGLVGLLSWHFIRIAPPEQVAATATSALAPAPVAALAPRPESPLASPVMAVPAPPPAAPELSRPVPPALVAAGAPARLAEQSQSRSAPAALRAADAVIGDAAERESGRVLRTVRALYPELFDPASPPGGHPAVTVTIALNADGSVYASARSAASAQAPSPGDAASLIAQAFGRDTGALAQSGVTMTAEGVTVIYGIRATPAGSSP